MADTNLFQELKDVLEDFKEFLDDNENFDTIRQAVQQLAALIPQIVELLDLLINLLTQLKTEVQNLDVSNIPGLEKVSQFTGQINALVEAARPLLPDDAGDDVDEVLEVAGVVTSLPSLEDVKAEIVSLIDAINTHLNSLKPA